MFDWLADDLFLRGVSLTFGCPISQRTKLRDCRKQKKVKRLRSQKSPLLSRPGYNSAIFARSACFAAIIEGKD